MIGICVAELVVVLLLGDPKYLLTFLQGMANFNLLIIGPNVLVIGLNGI